MIEPFEFDVHVGFSGRIYYVPSIPEPTSLLLALMAFAFYWPNIRRQW